MPSITSVSPSQAGPGATVVIHGSGMTSVVAVRFGGAPATSITHISSSQLEAVVPSMSRSSTTVTVDDGGGGTASDDFHVLIPGPWVQPADQWGEYLAWGTSFDPLFWASIPQRQYLDGSTYDLPDPNAGAQFGGTVQEEQSVSSGVFGPAFDVRFVGLVGVVSEALAVFDVGELVDYDQAADVAMPPVSPALPAGAADVQYEHPGGAALTVRWKLQVANQVVQEWFGDDRPPQPGSWDDDIIIRRLDTYTYSDGRIFNNHTPVRGDFVDVTEANAGDLLATIPARVAGTGEDGTTQPDGTTVNPNHIIPGHSYSDDFNRADNPLTIGWGVTLGDATWGIDTNRAHITSAGGFGNHADLDSLAFVGGLTFDGDYVEVSVTYETLDAGSSAGIAVGIERSGGTDAFFYRISPTEIRRVRVEAGVVTEDVLLQTYSGGFVSGDRITVGWLPTRITVFNNGVEVTHVDGGFDLGQVGMVMNGTDTGTFLDDFEAHSVDRWVSVGEDGDTWIDPAFDIDASTMDAGNTRFAIVAAASRFLAGDPPEALSPPGEFDHLTHLDVNDAQPKFFYRPPRYRFLYFRPGAPPTVRQRQIPGQVRQRQMGSVVRQRQIPR